MNHSLMCLFVCLRLGRFSYVCQAQSASFELLLDFLPEKGSELPGFPFLTGSCRSDNVTLEPFCTGTSQAAAWFPFFCGGVLHSLSTTGREFCCHPFLENEALPSHGFLPWYGDMSVCHRQMNGEEAGASFLRQVATFASDSIAATKPVMLRRHPGTDGRNARVHRVASGARWPVGSAQVCLALSLASLLC